MTYSNFSGSQPLTIDQIAHFAPSALAPHAHESRSNRYAYIPTINVIEGMMKNGFQPFKASQSLARLEDRRTFTKHMIRFRHQDIALAVGDSIPEIILINSHDGSSAYKLIAGIFRVVCGNGLVVAESTFGSITVRHSGNVLQEVVNGSHQIIEGSQKAMTAAREWSHLQLTDGEQKAFAESAHILRFGDSEGETETPFTPEQLLQPRRSEDYSADLWHVMNRVQENAIKGGLAARTQSRYDENGHFVPSRRVRTREVKGIDQDVRLNRALWQLAEKMAELKTPQAA